jgi:hypothetical protein
MKTHPTGCIFVLDVGVEVAKTKTHPSRCAFMLDVGMSAAARHRT